MSASAFRANNSVTTLLAIQNQLMFSTGIDITSDLATTINFKHNVLPNIGLSDLKGAIPRIRYFGIGIKGYANLTSENNLAQPYMPTAEQYDLYEAIPFRCVPNTPLEGSEADQYRIVTTKVINGVKHYLYWLKRIAFETSTIGLTKIEGNTETTYTADTAANLNPVPNDLFYTDVADAKTRIVASVSGVCKITGKEVLEVINNMYGGDMRRARISEFGTYSGVEVGLDTDGDLPARTEAAYTQLCTHECTLGELFDNEDHVHTRRVTFENGSSVTL